MSALATFRRAMQRHEKRARAMGLRDTRITIRSARVNCPEELEVQFENLREPGCDGFDRTSCFLRALAAAAVARLRASTS